MEIDKNWPKIMKKCYESSKNSCKSPKNYNKTCNFPAKLLANKNGHPNWCFACFFNSDLNQLSANN